ncbi:hypothetical protein FKM82_019467 [Ascaphus truei]
MHFRMKCVLTTLAVSSLFLPIHIIQLLSLHLDTLRSEYYQYVCIRSPAFDTLHLGLATPVLKGRQQARFSGSPCFRTGGAVFD